jgi:hypothetical protein
MAFDLAVLACIDWVIFASIRLSLASVTFVLMTSTIFCALIVLRGAAFGRVVKGGITWGLQPNQS